MRCQFYSQYDDVSFKKHGVSKKTIAEQACSLQSYQIFRGVQRRWFCGSPKKRSFKFKSDCSGSLLFTVVIVFVV
jgi:hypothetical protein